LCACPSADIGNSRDLIRPRQIRMSDKYVLLRLRKELVALLGTTDERAYQLPRICGNCSTFRSLRVGGTPPCPVGTVYHRVISIDQNPPPSLSQILTDKAPLVGSHRPFEAYWPYSATPLAYPLCRSLANLGLCVCVCVSGVLALRRHVLLRPALPAGAMGRAQAAGRVGG
jgi:hypothetical protein